MENLSPEAKELIGLSERGANMVAMLAPSFVVVFDYPQIIGMLKNSDSNELLKLPGELKS